MIEINTFYNRYWEPIYRLLNNWRIVGFNGISYWFIDWINLYNYSWKHVWFYDSWLLRDLNWYVVWFWEKVTSNVKPLLPLKHLKPIPYIVTIEPIRPIKSIPYIKPIYSFYWSDIDLEILFNQ